VIALGEGGATETVLPPSGGHPGTGLFFSQQTVDSLCQALEQFETCSGWFDPALARAQAERFARERFERELVGYLEQVAGQGMVAPEGRHSYNSVSRQTEPASRTGDPIAGHASRRIQHEAL
jgi:hypothetical protein